MKQSCNLKYSYHYDVQLLHIFLPRFLWTLYCNDSGTHITRTEFQNALQIENNLPPDGSNKINLTLNTLFGVAQDRVGFDHFKAWIQYHKDATILSKW